MNDYINSGAEIRVIGVGGGGNNAVAHMIEEGIEDVKFMCVNTDAQALDISKAEVVMQLGNEITKGLGAGANPQVGKQAAIEDTEALKEMIDGSDMLFITAGMGGGTGTGAAPVIAELAKSMGILTVAVVTKPFAFEGKKRMLIAEEGIRELAQHVDSLITIPNNKLLSVLGKSVTLLSAFRSANAVLQGAVQGISDLIKRGGLVNVDFADVRTVMSEMGMAMMGTGRATGENRARQAAESAISSPLLEDIDLSGAKGVLVNITAGSDMSIGEFEVVGDTIRSFTSEDATVVVGTVIDLEMTDTILVTVVVTGLDNNNASKSNDKTAKRAAFAEMAMDASVTNNEPRMETETVGMSAAEPSFLDIPAFLRKKDDDSNE
ncbi:MAG: cell division protein FtsZ [Candidatus Comchoanobacterales bacterium]